jgi:hypothetical protein
VEDRALPCVRKQDRHLAVTPKGLPKSVLREEVLSNMTDQFKRRLICLEEVDTGVDGKEIGHNPGCPEYEERRWRTQ